MSDGVPISIRKAVITAAGVMLNRFNVTFIAFNWRIPEELRYVPSWMEVVTSLTIITAGLLAFRWIVDRMPVLHPHRADEPPRDRGVHPWSRTTC